jgi:dipeptidase
MLWLEILFRHPYINLKLPHRVFVVAKQEVKLYQCENFERRNQIGVLEIGETADLGRKARRN